MVTRVLVADPIDKRSVEMLTAAGFEVVVRPEISAAELLETIAEFDAVMVRGRTKVTSEVISRGVPRLKVVGRAGVGLDNVDLDAAAKHGVKVFNTPESSTNSVAELVIGLMIAVARKIAWSDRVMRAGAVAEAGGDGVRALG
jgi:D-3-phosphoglycerate dehydrogenase